MSIPRGSRLRPYEIVSPIGAGGMGEVFLARDTRLERQVAIKILPRAFAVDDERARRFTREAQVASAINHPNVDAIYDVGESGDVRFIAMEFVEGRTLAERIAAGPLPLAEIIDLAQPITEALEAAHASGVVHRDIKPANLMITPARESARLRAGPNRSCAGRRLRADEARGDLTGACHGDRRLHES